MAQTTHGLSFIKALVFVSADGSTWTDASGHGASVAVSGGERATGEQHTMDGDTPIVKSGKRGSVDVTVRYVYTEETDEPFEVVRAQYEIVEGPLHVQYAPAGAAGFWFKTGEGICRTIDYPQGEAGPGDVLLSGFVVKCASLTKAAAST